MGNKISLWIKQRLFTSRNYDETMNALEKFSLNMKGSDEIALLEAVEKEQAQQVIAKVNTDEQRSRARRRRTSDTTTNKSITNSYITSFLQYLRHELRSTINERSNEYQQSIPQVNMPKDNPIDC